MTYNVFGGTLNLAQPNFSLLLGCVSTDGKSMVYNTIQYNIKLITRHM